MPGKISFIQPNITSLFPGKTPFQEGSFMKVSYLLLISLLIVGALFVPAVSAEELVNEHLSYYMDTSVSRSEGVTTTGISGVYNFDRIHLKKIENHKNTAYFSLTIDSNQATDTTYMEEGRHTIDYTLLGVTKPCVVYCQHNKNLLGQTTSAVYTIFPQNWDIGTGAGPQYIEFSEYLFKDRRGQTDIYVRDDYGVDDYRQNYDIAPCGYTYITSTRFEYYGPWGAYNIFVSSNQAWENTVLIETAEPDLIHVMVGREIDGKGYESDLSLIHNGNLTYHHTGVLDFEQYFPPSLTFDTAVITDAAGNNYTYVIDAGDAPIDPVTPPTYSVTVYAQNGDTGALIADTNLSVNLYETETWYNSTLEWGWDTIQLPAGNYEFYAEKSGFTQYAPGRLTVDGVGDNINLLLYPDVVAPPAGNLTLQFWVCDSNSNGIPYAELSVIGLAGEGADYDSGIIQTNNLGYATLTAPGNSTYTAYASKPGYTAGENEFGVTTGSPVHIAVMLMAGEIPTNPTATQPGVTATVTPTVRPTDVAPQNNPIDNFRIMFLNMGFDDEYSDWLTGLFIVCIGAVIGYVLAKKFGAMCGAPIGLVTATGLGLIPIWALVLIIVIVALAYAKFIMGR
jgi:hypothetical protein